MFNQFSTVSPTSVVGTWKAVDAAFINGQRQTELAVAQFKPDGTFVEGFDVANQASTYTGRYSYDGQRIAFIIDTASGNGPQPVPFHQQALSSTVFLGNPTTMRLNNDLTFAFESTSVAPSDFVLPPAPSATPFAFSNRTPFPSMVGFGDHSPLFAVHAPFF